ncbi:hypothetical protein HPB52_011275 [Rhipicephalus sanguineus]|uniref:Uncharacterized protein n=1 Tax=Rhipicephalus sanguineus TaxID=34632 RepID=A0A9D4T9H7_RHISA|nr:hypothetical protein HPB52_011275 [Rhipicephalus sanguineus]
MVRGSKDQGQFQNTVGTSIESFNDLLFKYLESTVINHNDNFYVQKAGICIGSRVAPVLSDLLVAQFDRDLEASGLPNVVKNFPLR